MGRDFFQLLVLLLLVHKTSAYGSYLDIPLDGGDTMTDEWEPEARDEEICKNTDNGAVDSYGDDCSYYNVNPWDCKIEEYKTEHFDMEEMCCGCGGGSQQNAIYGQIIFDTTKCSNLELNHAVLYEALAPYFQYTAGIDILQIDSNMPSGTIGFEIDISTDGLHINPSIHDFESVKTIIRDSIDCDDRSGIDLSHFDTFAYESMVEGFIPDELDSSRGRVEDQNIAVDNEESSRSRYRTDIIIPHEKSYRNLIGDIRDQGRIGSCVAFASDGMFQFFEHRDNNIVQEFSPKYFYYHRKFIGKPGMSPVKVGDITRRAGAVPETVYPYIDVKDTEGERAIPENIKSMGREYGHDNYENYLYFCTRPTLHTDVQDFRQAIQSYIAIYGVGIISLPTYDQSCEFWKFGGRRRLSRHSMVVDGYDENGLHLRNSWGLEWCENGYTSMNWSDAFKRSFHLCFWKKPIDLSMTRFEYAKVQVQTDCLVEKNVAYDDGDLENVPNVGSAEKCAHLCYKSPRCLTWTYESRTCYMKDKYRYNKQDKDRSISGLPCSKEACAINGHAPTGKQCSCSGTICAADQFCYDGMCNDNAKCHVNYWVRTGKQCRCYDSICNSNQFCYNQKCNNKEAVPCRATFVTNTGRRHHGIRAIPLRDFWYFEIYDHPWHKFVSITKHGRHITHKYGRRNNYDSARGGNWQWKYSVRDIQFCFQ